MASAALSGIRVMDLSTVVFGPYAAQVLADYGADVVKIEPPGGNSTRSVGPAAAPDMSALFLGVNRNKRSVVLDLKLPAAVAALLRLVDGADVIMHSMRPHKMAALGLDADTLCARNPRLIYAGLHGFGEGGVYARQPAYDDIIQGLSGAADAMHRQTGQPGYLPTIAADKVGGLVAAHAVLAALFQRERTGAGQRLEVPMFEAMTSFMLAEHYHGRHVLDDDGSGRQPAGYARAMAPGRRPYATRDGHVCVMPYTDEHWRRFFTRTGHAAHAADARFATLAERTRHVTALYDTVAEIVADEPTSHWLALCRELDVPAASVNSLEALDDDPHLQSVGFFVDIGAGEQSYRFPRSPVRLQNSHVEPTMPPRLGAHTVEVLRSAGLPPGEIDELLATGAAADGGPIPA